MAKNKDFNIVFSAEEQKELEARDQGLRDRIEAAEQVSLEIEKLMGERSRIEESIKAGKEGLQGLLEQIEEEKEAISAYILSAAQRRILDNYKIENRFNLPVAKNSACK